MLDSARQRPVMVWAISIVVGLIALSQLLIQSMPMLPGSSVQIMPALSEVVASTPILDRTILFLSSAILLTSMVLLFRMRMTSLVWFSGYLGLGAAAVARYALTPTREAWFSGPASLIGIAIAAAILTYMWQLKRREILT